MQAGNGHYRKASDLPEVIPVFPLIGGLLLPRGQMPLNIFEPRYLVMIDEVLAGDRLIGIIQPKIINGVAVEDKEGAAKGTDHPELSDVGCLGRITSYTETGDGRVLITLQGICRFRLGQELKVAHPFRMAHITPYLQDLEEEQDEDQVDREALLQAFRDYLEANNLDADWESIAKAGNETLVNALSMMSPFGAAEKQALLEAADLRTRSETLVAITEIALVRSSDDYGSGIQ
jgi:Lon protease-like protein